MVSDAECSTGSFQKVVDLGLERLLVPLEDHVLSLLNQFGYRVELANRWGDARSMGDTDVHTRR